MRVLRKITLAAQARSFRASKVWQESTQGRHFDGNIHDKSHENAMIFMTSACSKK